MKTGRVMVPAKEVKMLLRAMVYRALNYGLTPLYIQCPYWEDEGFAHDANGEFRLVMFPAQQVDGIPIQFKQDVCKLYCQNRQIIRAWLTPEYEIRIRLEFE